MWPWAELVIITDGDCFLCGGKLLTAKNAKKVPLGRKENLKTQRTRRTAAEGAERGCSSAEHVGCRLLFFSAKKFQFAAVACWNFSLHWSPCFTQIELMCW